MSHGLAFGLFQDHDLALEHTNLLKNTMSLNRNWFLFYCDSFVSELIEFSLFQKRIYCPWKAMKSLYLDLHPRQNFEPCLNCHSILWTWTQWILPDRLVDKSNDKWLTKHQLYNCAENPNIADVVDVILHPSLVSLYMLFSFISCITAYQKNILQYKSTWPLWKL